MFSFTIINLKIKQRNRGNYIRIISKTESSFEQKDVFCNKISEMKRLLRINIHRTVKEYYFYQIVLIILTLYPEFTLVKHVFNFGK
mmetsp:Transcript_31348/g.50494  ORF Transcript_31348/g.50494 Transcript_31348/m.50494 type:complete len:86 (+) Transcript_31348:1982-2239(+)